MTTAQQTAKDKMIAIIKSKSTSMLKTTAMLLMNNVEEGATLSFTFVMNELEDRMTEKDFCDFCESL